MWCNAPHADPTLMNTLAEFKDYYKRLDEMITKSTKADLAECARLLALNVADSKAKYGELPLEEHQAMLEANDIDEEMAQLLVGGVLEMAVVLALVTGRSEEYEEMKGANARIH
ncbi:MAG: hypothetical protein V3T19_00650 [Acidiferrobacterales bacterium]